MGKQENQNNMSWPTASWNPGSGWGWWTWAKDDSSGRRRWTEDDDASGRGRWTEDNDASGWGWTGDDDASGWWTEDTGLGRSGGRWPAASSHEATQLPEEAEESFGDEDGGTVPAGFELPPGPMRAWFDRERRRWSQDKSARERLEFENQQLQDKLAHLQAAEWSRELEYETKKKALQENKEKFEMDCAAKVMLIYKESHEKVQQIKQEKEQFIAAGTWFISEMGKGRFDQLLKDLDSAWAKTTELFAANQQLVQKQDSHEEELSRTHDELARDLARFKGLAKERLYELNAELVASKTEQARYRRKFRKAHGMLKRKRSEADDSLPSSPSGSSELTPTEAVDAHGWLGWTHERGDGASTMDKNRAGDNKIVLGQASISQCQATHARTKVWYQTIAGAGVAELLETIRSGPQVDSLGVSYFGNDITRTPITTQVQADWKEFIQAVKLKSKRSVFVIGGYAAKFPSMRLSSTYDQNLQYVRSLVEREGLYVTDLRQKVQEWKLCSDGIHWHDDEKEDVCATWARLLRGQLPPSCHPDSEDFADDSEPPGGDAPHFKDTVRRVLQESITISTTVGDINPASPLMKNIA
ncbi:unnamed protein product [Symbiodinium sp. KB8]|nr:unnamed protein product [Symbiodinium sp. KB8]